MYEGRKPKASEPADPADLTAIRTARTPISSADWVALVNQRNLMRLMYDETGRPLVWEDYLPQDAAGAAAPQISSEVLRSVYSPAPDSNGHSLAADTLRGRPFPKPLLGSLLAFPSLEVQGREGEARRISGQRREGLEGPSYFAPFREGSSLSGRKSFPAREGLPRVRQGSEQARETMTSDKWKVARGLPLTPPQMSRDRRVIQMAVARQWAAEGHYDPVSVLNWM
jgi:hypothetical protein